MENKQILIVFVVIVLAVVILNNFGGNFTGLARGGILGKPNYQCSDGIDNDRDGYCDFLWKNAKCSDGSRPGDPGCISKDDNDESTDCLPVCYTNSDCGINGYVGSSYCDSDGNLYKNYQSFTCENAGKCSSVCNEQISSLLWQNCEFGCSNDQCNSQPIGCSDTDNGIDEYKFGQIYINGTLTSSDVCGNFSNSNFAEKYCVDNWFTIKFFNCQSGCINGACKIAVCGDSICDTDQESSSNCPNDCPIATTCTDSDGGDNKFTKGTTSGLNAGGSQATFTDYCNGGFLYEYLCSSTSSEVFSNQYSCPCQDGACTEDLCGNGLCETGETLSNCPSDCQITTCTDSDGGKNFYVRGTTSGLNAANNPYTATDYCSGSTLYEYLCSGSNIVFDITTCNCANGACYICGDGSCNVGETCSICPNDCGVCATNSTI